MSAVATLLVAVESVSRSVRAVTGTQVQSAGITTELHDLAKDYFSNVKSIAEQCNGGSEMLDGIFQEVHAISRKKPSKKRCLELLKSAKKALVVCEGSAISQSSRQQAGNKAPVDELIIASLDEICPSASLAYQQALIDLSQDRRFSWRGPATDLREALRETLDILAPDKDVESSPGFKFESDAKCPTMKQKVRYILKNRGANSGSMAPPEHAVQGIESVIGTLTRSVYTRSSVSTHTPTDRPEVARVHAWVRLVLCELLEIPL
jgi:hypothetical protein